MIRCCLCREIMRNVPDFEPTDLPGSGWRCTNRTACAQRVRGVVAAHKGFGEVCDER